MILQIDRAQKYFGVIPKILFSDKGSYIESDTKKYDEVNFINFMVYSA